jgi:hypothetical protein
VNAYGRSKLEAEQVVQVHTLPLPRACMHQPAMHAPLHSGCPAHAQWPAPVQHAAHASLGLQCEAAGCARACMLQKRGSAEKVTKGLRGAACTRRRAGRST